MQRSTHAVSLGRELNGRQARRLAVAGVLSLATVVAAVGAVAPQPSEAATTLSCKGRQPTVLAIPGVRTVGTSSPDVIVGLPLIKDTIDGRGGGDVICGLDRRDFLHGGTDNDEVRGNHGSDFLFGEDGDDLLRGGPNDDVLRGGPGFDRCFGGAGRDAAIDCERVRAVERQPV